MSLRKTALLAISFFLLTLNTGVAIAKTSTNKSKPETKKWAVIDGFRSAKFGMDKKKVTRAIAKDFKISPSKVKLAVHPTEKTTTLGITVPKLLAAGGDAQVTYILGQKSKELMQVNVVWGAGATKNVNPKEVVAAANLLRGHFIKKRYQDDMLAANAKVSESLLIVFRGKDKKGRMVLLTLISPIPQEGEDKKEVSKKMQLRLSYKLDPVSPDVLTIKEGEF